MRERGLSVAAYVLTALGILGIIIALVTEQSDYDPVAFGIATVSILVAVVGLSIFFRSQRGEPAGPNEPKLSSEIII